MSPQTLFIMESIHQITVMRHRLVRRLLAALVLLPFLGGTTLRAMPAASTGGASAAMDCIHMTMPGQGDQAGKSVPCRTNNIDCLKQMACVGPLVLPARTGEQLAVTYVPVSYWPVAFSGTGRSIAPEPFPPTVV
jgi:hypothetical protein